MNMTAGEATQTARPRLAAPPRRRGEFVLAGLALLALFALYLEPAIFGGQALLPADLLFRDPVWQGLAPAGFTPHNPLLVDQVYQFYPWRLFAAAQWAAGRLPLWNPYAFSGTPFIANDQSAVFYPINLVLAWLPAYLAPGWSALLRLLIAAGGSYALLRCWQASPAAALTAGISFALGSFVVLLLGHPHGNVAVWLPWLILSAEMTLTALRPWPWALLAAAVIGVQFLGGHAETSFFVLLAWALFCLVAAVAAVRGGSGAQRRRIAGRLALAPVALVAGAALAGVQLLPFLELLPQSNYYLFRAGLVRQGQPLVYLGFWRDLLRLPTLFLPNIYGNPTRGNWWIGTGLLNYTGVLYMGIVPLFLAAAGAWLRRREWRPAFLAGLGLFSLAVLLRLPFLDWVRRLPLVNVASAGGGFQVIYCFCLAALAGFGFDAVLAEPGRAAGRRLAHALALFAGLGGVGLAAAYGLLRAFRPQLLALGRAYVERYVYGRPPHPFPLAFYLDQLDARYRQLLQLFDPGRAAVYWPVAAAAAAALILWLWRGSRLPRAAAHWSLVALTVLDLWAFGVDFNPTLPRAQVLPVTPALAWLVAHQGHSRVAGIGDILPANTGMAFGLADVRGYDAGIGRYSGVLAGLDHTPAGLTLTERNQRFFDLTAVRYLIAAQPLAAAGLRLAYDGEVKIYEREGSRPRAYLAGAYTVGTDAENGAAILSDADVATGERVLLEVPPTGLASGSATGGGTAEITGETPLAVTIVTDGPRAELLVLADAYYPGWQAQVDGRMVPIYRADYLFRAVVVPAGRHDVTFTYRPVSFYAGAGLSLAALAVLACIALVCARRYAGPSDRLSEWGGQA